MRVDSVDKLLILAAAFLFATAVVFLTLSSNSAACRIRALEAELERMRGEARVEK